MKENRRDFIKKSTALAALSVAGIGSASAGMTELNDSKIIIESKASAKNNLKEKVQWPVIEGPNTPKLCMICQSNADEKQMRRLKQLGVDYTITDAPRIPWKENDLRARMENLKKGGLTVMNMMIGEFPNTIYGREGRDTEIRKVQESLRAAGAAGLPVVEYNFFVDRLIEGYYEIKGRGGAGILAFDYAPVKDLPAKPEIGTYTAEQLWENLTYFLKAVIPVAEKAGVRMAMHPNDPPAPISHGSPQIMATFNDWKRLIEIVDSPSNGITYDCGVSREIGEDPLEVLTYFGTRDRINHMHFRNVIVQEPYVKYEEDFNDVGQVNMFAVMQEVIRLKYKLGIYPEHPRALDYDIENEEGISAIHGGYTGFVFNVAYARAMMQAAMS